MPKGKSPKMNGCVCNVPIDKVDVLPRPADSNGIAIVKLKRKAVYRSHVLFEAVRPNFERNVLEYIISNSQLYLDISVNMNNVPLTLQCFETDEDVDTDPVITELLRCPSETLEVYIRMT